MVKGFSALQRAENFSMPATPWHSDERLDVSVLFSEPKISQSRLWMVVATRGACFSALQRAENFSIDLATPDSARELGFQCSSASRKFLNFPAILRLDSQPRVSVLFSEPKISQSTRQNQDSHWSLCFSALQRAENFSIRFLHRVLGDTATFQCSSASRKFLNRIAFASCTTASSFQCSSASRKFLNEYVSEHASGAV